METKVKHKSHIITLMYLIW